MPKLEDHKIIKLLKYASETPDFSVAEISDAGGITDVEFMNVFRTQMFREAVDDLGNAIRSQESGYYNFSTFYIPLRLI